MSAKVLLGILAGVVSGVLFGILTAPERGSDTRKKISQKRKDYADALKEKFNQFLDNLSENSKRIGGEVFGIVRGGKNRSKETEKDVMTVTESIDQKVV
jgi:gas vesicle protein